MAYTIANANRENSRISYLKTHVPPRKRVEREYRFNDPSPYSASHLESVSAPKSFYSKLEQHVFKD